MKTSELIGPTLDWAVAKCYGVRLSALQEHGRFEIHFSEENGCEIYAPSTDWSQGGPIIERERIDILGCVNGPTGEWTASLPRANQAGWRHLATGPTPLIAAMRCFVASKLGEEVELPEDLK